MGTASMCIIKLFWISEICIKIGHISDAVRVKPPAKCKTSVYVLTDFNEVNDWALCTNKRPLSTVIMKN